MGATLSFLALLVAIAGPALLLAFQILAAEQEDASLTTELWFGVEVAVYIICPLLVLTVFGTVNYCKVSLTSRLLPSHQVQAVKLNIGVTVTANLAIFLFLVQECLGLWLSQLEARSDPESVAEVRSLVEVAHACSSWSWCSSFSFASPLPLSHRQLLQAMLLSSHQSAGGGGGVLHHGCH